MRIDLDALWRVIEALPVTPGNVRTHGTGRNTAEGEILVAVDENGARTLLFPVGDDDGFAPDSSTKVHLGTRLLRWSGGEGTFVAVTCQVDRLKPVFTTLAEDMLEAAEGATNPGAVIRQILDEWRDLLSAEAGSLLPRHRVVGLIAELLTLRDVLSHDPTRDVGVWTGPDEALHDLRRAGSALEVKGSLIREGLYVEIHGLRQLEAPAGGDLHLLLHRLEEDPGGDLSLPGLVHEILDLGVSRHEFVELLGRAGYDIADEADYATRRFRRVEARGYKIDEAFPRVVPGSFSAGDAPAGVMLVRYTVDLTGPSPTPMAEHEIEDLLADFGGGA
jgi:hypothetical protein